MPQDPDLSGLHEEILAIMAELELPAPERMLGRIEEMLPKGDRTRVLKALVQDSQRQSKQETMRILKVLGSKDEWAVEVDRLLRNYSPV